MEQAMRWILLPLLLSGCSWGQWEFEGSPRGYWSAILITKKGVEISSGSATEGPSLIVGTKSILWVFGPSLDNDGEAIETLPVTVCSGVDTKLPAGARIEDFIRVGSSDGC